MKANTFKIKSKGKQSVKAMVTTVVVDGKPVKMTVYAPVAAPKGLTARCVG